MPKQEAPLHQLQSYLPAGAYEAVAHYLQTHKVQLTITRERKSILGDYRHSFLDKNHRISINGNLNSYSFLITLLHELAHLFTYERFGNKVLSHGAEWKSEFGEIISQFLLKKIFPTDIEKVLLKSIISPAASSCGDVSLLKVLRKYDLPKEGIVLVESLAHGELFKIKDNQIFKRDEKIRKRFKCIEIKTGKIYLFSPVYEVIKL